MKWGLMILVLIFSPCCSVKYGFRVVNLPPDVKSLYVDNVEAGGGSPPPWYISRLPVDIQTCLSGKLGLTVAPPGGADILLKITISGYDVEPVGIQSGDTPSSNRLKVTYVVSSTFVNYTERNTTKTITLWYDYPASQSLGEVENTLLEKINEQLCNEIAWKVINEW